MSVEKAPERAPAGFNPSLAQRCNRLDQSQVGLFGNQSQNFGGALFQRRNAAAARLRRGALPFTPALQPFDAELTLTSKRSAASRRDAPVSTASITRSRKSPEKAFGIAKTPERRINIRARWRQDSKGIKFVMLNHFVIRRLIQAHHSINRRRPWQLQPFHCQSRVSKTAPAGTRSGPTGHPCSTI